MPARTVHARAHAKLNLALSVGPPLDAGPCAGMHPIASWMHAVDLCDDLTLRVASAAAYDLAWADGRPLGWATESDLCVRAHRAVERLAGRELPVALTLRKRVPDGGGLGGGSADAAAVLLGLRDLFALDLPDRDLWDAARALGSDVAFFLDPVAWQAEQPPRPAVVTGLGEEVERAGRLGAPVTLVCPPFGCPTGRVYAAFDAAGPGAGPDEARVRSLATAGRPGGLFNDLTPAAEAVEPRVGALRRSLETALGAPVHLSGSGSTLFCFESAERVRAHAPGCRVIAARLV